MDDDVTWRPGRTIPLHELTFEMDAAGGPGGQHANRSATRVSLVWVPADSSAFSDLEKERLQKHLQTRINQRGELRLRSAEERSAERNRRRCLELLAELVRQALTVRKKRVATRPTRASKRRRLDAKSRRSSTKRLRRPPSKDD